MQSLTPLCPIVQGAYSKWFLVEGESAEISVDNAQPEWIESLEEPSIQPEQYDLDLDLCVAPETTFRQLVDQWRQERGASSSTTEILLCPSYQSIIGMGEQAIPLILAQMESEGDDPDQWFWALQILGHANPVREEDEGNFRAMAEAWFGWARKRYFW
jgi:hypothetical protein